MAKVLDTSAAFTIAEALAECLDDLGFPPEEAIPGLVLTIHQQAEGLGRSCGTALDEASDLLADGVE
jgi:hypothetical protein